MKGRGSYFGQREHRSMREREECEREYCEGIKECEMKRDMIGSERGKKGERMGGESEVRGLRKISLRGREERESETEACVGERRLRGIEVVGVIEMQGGEGSDGERWE